MNNVLRFGAALICTLPLAACSGTSVSINELMLMIFTGDRSHGSPRETSRGAEPASFGNAERQSGSGPSPSFATSGGGGQAPSQTQSSPSQAQNSPSQTSSPSQSSAPSGSNNVGSNAPANSPAAPPDNSVPSTSYDTGSGMSPQVISGGGGGKGNGMDTGGAPSGTQCAPGKDGCPN